MAANRHRTRIAARAFAKINLTLRVVGGRLDGFHELRTTYQSIALADELSIVERRGPFEIECDELRCPVDRSNLVWRAAEIVWKAAKRRGAPRDVAVRIAKRIPIQAGLGGGSSDAAAAVRAFVELWRADVDRERLQRMAAQLGADVPFFLAGGTALGLGRGDQLFQLVDLPRAWVVLVVPPFGVSTREAYAWWDEDTALQSTTSVVEAADGNDLERAVVRRHPEIATVVRRLRTAGASYASMSGSGSAVFALFPARRAAEIAAARFVRPLWKVIVTRTVDRREYTRIARPRIARVTRIR